MTDRWSLYMEGGWAKDNVLEGHAANWETGLMRLAENKGTKYMLPRSFSSHDNDALT